MKTLTTSEFQNLSEVTRKEIESLINSRETTVSELKKRITSLSQNYIDYRTDSGAISGKKKEDVTLILSWWEKTGGEQWGNASSYECSVSIGRKYIRINLFHDYTNNGSWNKYAYLSTEQLEKIVTLIETAEAQDNETDKKKYYIMTVKTAISYCSSIFDIQYF